ncbi:MAG: hypothetical protein ACK4NF_00765 [Planctomycetota bacterium]
MGESQIKVDKLQIGSKLSRDVISADNRIVVKKDTVIDKETLDILILNSIEEVWIYDDNSALIKETVDKIFSRTQNDDFMGKLYKIVLDFRIKNNL